MMGSEQVLNGKINAFFVFSMGWFKRWLMCIWSSFHFRSRMYDKQLWWLKECGTVFSRLFVCLLLRPHKMYFIVAREYSRGFEAKHSSIPKSNLSAFSSQMTWKVITKAPRFHCTQRFMNHLLSLKNGNITHTEADSFMYFCSLFFHMNTEHHTFQRQHNKWISVTSCSMFVAIWIVMWPVDAEIFFAANSTLRT